MKKVLLSGLAIFTILVSATVIAVLYANGYRLSQENGKTFVAGTGVIVLTSKPDGARVYVNDHLTTATNNTINLKPGEYDVRVEKDGYYPWRKNIIVKQGEVSNAAATLFPSTPKLDPLSTTGALNVVVDATNTLIAYTTNGGSTVGKNGLYLLDMSSRPILPIGGLATQLANNTVVDFTNAQLEFSPDGDELLASVSGELGTSLYLLSTKGFNDLPQDVTNTIEQVRVEWAAIADEQETRAIRSLNTKLRPYVTKHFNNFVLSPDDDKILYTASGSASLPLIKVPPLKGVNSTPEIRDIKDTYTYVYDIKEDRNYLVWEGSTTITPSPMLELEENESTTSAATAAIPKFFWHPNSTHLAYIEEGQIKVMEFDRQNITTLYAGPFTQDFATIWPDGSNLVILTNLNIATSPFNLYKVSLK